MLCFREDRGRIPPHPFAADRFALSLFGAVLPIPVLLTLIATLAPIGKADADDPEPVVLENREGVALEARVLSVIRMEESDGLWVCFQPLEKDRLFLYPSSFLSEATVTRLSTLAEGGNLLVADGVSAWQLDFLERYLEAGPRERLALELREARKKENLLEREWKRLQGQTWELQQQVVRTRDAEHRKRVEALFRQSLEARDRVGKQYVLCQATIRRLEERIETLRGMGVEIDMETLFRSDDPVR